MSGRPVPVPDEQSAPFWAAAADGRLVLARCRRCEGFTHPPTVLCPRCQSTDPQWTFDEVSGAGEVCSWTLLHQSFVPGFDDVLPLVLVDVRLDGTDDVRLVGRLVDGAGAPLHQGARVDLTFDDGVPAFTLAGA